MNLMPLDAVCLRAVLSELNTRIAGARLKRYISPTAKKLCSQLRGGQGAMQIIVFCLAVSAAYSSH